MNKAAYGKNKLRQLLCKFTVGVSGDGLAGRCPLIYSKAQLHSPLPVPSFSFRSRKRITPKHFSSGVNTSFSLKTYVYRKSLKIL